MENNNLEKIYIHPIFKSLSNYLGYFLVSMNMMSQPIFQNSLIKTHERGKSALGISVEFNGFECLEYDVQDVLSSFNKAIKLQAGERHMKCDLSSLLSFQARQTVIYLFDILQCSRFHKFLNKTDLFKFTKHIRNGAAHNNKFVFDKPLVSPVKWRNKTIVESLKGKEVFPSFITSGDLIILISDISYLISSVKY